MSVAFGVAATPRRTGHSYPIHTVCETRLDEMSDPPPHLSAFSTDMLPERERFDAFLEGMARKLVRIDVVTVAAATRRSSVRIFARLACGR